MLFFMILFEEYEHKKGNKGLKWVSLLKIKRKGCAHCVVSEEEDSQ